jgi:hypothetical protein
VLVIGVLAILLAIALQALFPRAMGPLPPGLYTPVLALEIARSPAEIETMFGHAGSDQRAQWVGEVDRGNQVDFAFIVVYVAFLIACARAFERARESRMRLAIGLALLAGCADAAENVCLLSITSRLGSDYSEPLSALIVATWVKWLALAACLALFSPAPLARADWPAKVSGAVRAAALPIAIAAAVLRGTFAEAMLGVITLAIVTLWYEALLRSNRAAKRAAAAAPARDPR